jgi:fructose-1,6-bisphosphatase/inositol monophosphatase family enzyme
MNHLQLARKAVDEAYREISSYSKEQKSVYTGEVGAGGDKTIAADVLSERAIEKILMDYGSPVWFISEESGAKKLNWDSRGEACFALVDPYDGSDNSRHGLEIYGTSVAIGWLINDQRDNLEKRCVSVTQIDACATKNLVNGDTYWASREYNPEYVNFMKRESELTHQAIVKYGESLQGYNGSNLNKEISKLEGRMDKTDLILHYGAFKNGERIHASKKEDFESSFGAVRFGYRKAKDQIVCGAPLFMNTRSLDSTVLEFAYVADGTYDYMLDMRGLLKICDVAAGSLLVPEAGGIVSSFYDLFGVACPVDDFKRRYNLVAAGNEILAQVVHIAAASVMRGFDLLFDRPFFKKALESNNVKSFFDIVAENHEHINKAMKSQKWKVEGINDQGIELSVKFGDQKLFFHALPYVAFEKKKTGYGEYGI